MPAPKEIFDFNEYKDYIRFRIHSPENARGYSASLARAAGIHGSFLSKVLSTHVHLTPDQGADFCAFWNLKDDETAYFLGLLNLARSSSKNLQSLIKKDLKTLKKKRDLLSQRFARSEAVESGNTGRYYSSWYFICIHMLLEIPQYRTPLQIAKRLGLSIDAVNTALAALAEMGLAEENAGQWKSKKSDLHLDRDSVWATVHYSSWLNRTILKLQEGGPREVTFSSVLTVTKKTAEEIKRLLISDLEEIRTKVIHSASEELYYLGINFYQV